MKKRMSFLAIVKELLTSKDQHGFSLAEVMVAAGMMGALSLVVVNLSKTANKTTKTISQTVEITEIHSTVLRALSIESACQETMTRSTSGGPALNVDGITGAPQPVVNIYGKITQLGTFPVVITSDPTDVNGDGKPDNEYGDQAGTVNVQGIQVENYIQTGTSAAAGERYGSVDIRITYRKGHQSAVGNDNIIKDGSYGGVNATKIIRGVQVVATTAGDIVSCRADSSQFLQAACDMFSGELLSSTVSSGFKCHNIKLFNTPDAGTGNLNNKFSLIGRHDAASPNAEGSIKAEGGLVVGSAGGMPQFTDDTVAPGQGNALIQNTLSVGANGAYNATAAVGANGALVQGALMVSGLALSKPAGAGVGDGYFTGGLTVGTDMTSTSTSANTAGDLSVQSNAKIQSSLYVGPFPAPAITDMVRINDTGAGAFTNSLSVTGGTTSLARTSDGVALSVTNGSTAMSYGSTITNVSAVKNSAVTVNVNSVTGYPLEVKQTNPNFRVSNSGTITIYNGSGTLAGNVVTQIASGAGAGYRPSYIYNMPTYSSGNLTASQYNEIPNKRWVLEAVYNSLSDQVDKTSLLNAVSNIAAQPFDAIMMAICDNIKVKSMSTGAYSSGAVSGANCMIDSYVCGDNGTTQRCSTHYSVNYNATGTLTVGGTASITGNTTIGGNLTANGGYIYATAGYIRSASYVRGDSHVYGGTYVQAGGSAKTGLSGICGSSGTCATRFGRYVCNNGGVVIGMVNGQLICARNGGGVSGPVGI